MNAKLKYCTGCKDNFYNGFNDLGIKKCWKLEISNIVSRKEVHINDIPPWNHQPIIKTLNCYRKKGFVYVDKDQIN